MTIPHPSVVYDPNEARMARIRRERTAGATSYEPDLQCPECGAMMTCAKYPRHGLVYFCTRALGEMGSTGRGQGRGMMPGSVHRTLKRYKLNNGHLAEYPTR